MHHFLSLFSFFIDYIGVLYLPLGIFCKEHYALLPICGGCFICQPFIGQRRKKFLFWLTNRNKFQFLKNIWLIRLFVEMRFDIYRIVQYWFSHSIFAQIQLAQIFIYQMGKKGPTFIVITGWIREELLISSVGSNKQRLSIDSVRWNGIPIFYLVYWQKSRQIFIVIWQRQAAPMVIFTRY